MLPAPIRLFRPGDWVKNAFVLIPLAFSVAGGAARPDGPRLHAMFIATGLAVAAFCLAGSGFYAINDALDAEEDRKHPVKRRRPVASGAVPAGAALSGGVALIAVALGLAWLARPEVAAVIGIYVLLQVAYNVKLKRVRFIDVATIASGFVLRAIAGALAIAVPVSIWLVVVVFTLTLFLGFVKRLADIRAVQLARERGDVTDWKPRAGYDSVEDLNWLLAVTGTVTIMAYLMYALSDHASKLFGARAMGFAVLTPLVLVVIHRMYLRANLGLGDSPISTMLGDRSARIAAFLFTGGVLASLYWPAVGEFLGRLFGA